MFEEEEGLFEEQGIFPHHHIFHELVFVLVAVEEEEGEVVVVLAEEGVEEGLEVLLGRFDFNEDEEVVLVVSVEEDLVSGVEVVLLEEMTGSCGVGSELFTQDSHFLHFSGGADEVFFILANDLENTDLCLVVFRDGWRIDFLKVEYLNGFFDHFLLFPKTNFELGFPCLSIE